jgi:hypothetical protein
MYADAQCRDQPDSCRQGRSSVQNQKGVNEQLASRERFSGCGYGVSSLDKLARLISRRICDENRRCCISQTMPISRTYTCAGPCGADCQGGGGLTRAGPPQHCRHPRRLHKGQRRLGMMANETCVGINGCLRLGVCSLFIVAQSDCDGLLPVLMRGLDWPGQRQPIGGRDCIHHVAAHAGNKGLIGIYEVIDPGAGGSFCIYDTDLLLASELHEQKLGLRISGVYVLACYGLRSQR